MLKSVAVLLKFIINFGYLIIVIKSKKQTKIIIKNFLNSVFSSIEIHPQET